MRALVIGITAAWTIACVCAAGDNTVYSVDFDRHWHQGERRTIELVYANVQTSTIQWQGEPSAPVVRETSWGLHLLADAIVLKLSDLHRITQESFTIRTCTQLLGGSEVPLLSPGKVLVATLDGKQTFYTIDGAPASERVSTALRKLVALHASESVIDSNTIFAPQAPVQVGQSWPVNAAVYAQAVNRWGYNLSVKDVSGQVTLDDVEPCNGIPCLKLEIDLKLANYSRPTTRAIAGYRVEPYTRTAHEQWLLPITPEKAVQSYSRTSIITYAVDGKISGRAYHTDEIFKEAVESRVLPQDQTRPR